MKLNKRIRRSIKNNVSFYVSSTILTVATIVLFFIMNMSGDAIWDYGDKFFKTQNVEDANFTTYIPLTAEDIESLEEEFDVTIENQLYSNIETDGTTARVFRKPKDINLYEVTVGKDNTENDEIIISEGYAVENEVEIGDFIKIGKKEYEVTGFFLRPDYLYMLQNESDAYKNVTTFFLAYMTDEEFDSLESSNSVYYVRFNQDNEDDFRKTVNKDFFMRTYVSAEDNMRIDMVKMQADMFIVMSYLILVILPLVVVVLVSTVIKRKVKSEQKMIGTLTALGYSKWTLMAHYARFAVIPGVLGGVLGVILSVIFAEPFGKCGLMDYEPMKIVCKVNPIAAVIAIVVPTIMYVLTAMKAVKKLLKKDTVLLLNANSDQGKKLGRNILVKKKISFRIKYALRSLIGNPSRSFVVLLGVFLGSFIAMLGYAFMDTTAHTQDTMAEGMGSFEYEYVLNELFEEGDYEGEALIMSMVEIKGGKQFSILGTTDDNPYIDLVDMDGNKISLNDGYFITSIAATLNDVEKGDEITLCNPLTLEEYKVEIAGIIDNNMQSAIYTNKKLATDILGIDPSLNNVIMTDVELDIPEEKLLQTIKPNDAKEQFKIMTDQMGPMIYVLIGFGAVICIAAIYIAVNMVVSENRSNISMLKVLGYEDKQINKIVLNINHILVPIGIVLSIPLVLLSVNWFMGWLASYIGVMPEPYVAPVSILYAVLLTCGSYFLSLFMLRRKVSKVDMVESLKDNRE